MPEPCSTSVSFESTGAPVTVSRPPTPVEFRQPRPDAAGALFPHGHAVALPSPAQYVLASSYVATSVPTSAIEPETPLVGSLKANVEFTGALSVNTFEASVSVPATVVGVDTLPVRSEVVAALPSGVTTICPASAVNVTFALNAPPAPTVNVGELADRTRLLTSIVASGGRNGIGLLIFPCRFVLVATEPLVNAPEANGCAPVCNVRSSACVPRSWNVFEGFPTIAPTLDVPVQLKLLADWFTRNVNEVWAVAAVARTPRVRARSPWERTKDRIAACIEGLRSAGGAARRARAHGRSLPDREPRERCPQPSISSTPGAEGGWGGASHFPRAPFAMTRSLDPILAEIKSLEPLPHVALRVLDLSTRDEVVPLELVAVIETDVAMTAKVLKLSNSAYYGFRREIGSLTEAGNLLGVSALVSLVLTGCAERYFRRARAMDETLQRALWEESVSNAIAAALLAKLVGGVDRSRAYTAGLLQNIGRLVLESHLRREAAEIERVEATGVSRLEAERAVLGVDHAEVGARLCEHWGFPAVLCDTVRHHHEPERAELDPALCYAVHLGEQVSQSLTQEKDPTQPRYPIASGALERLHLAEGALEGLQVLLVRELDRAREFVEA